MTNEVAMQLLMDWKHNWNSKFVIQKHNRNPSLGSCSPLTACASIRLFKFFIAWSGFTIQFCPLHLFPWWCTWGTMFARVLFLGICIHSLAACLYKVQYNIVIQCSVQCSQLCFLIYHTTQCSYWIPSFQRKEPQ